MPELLSDHCITKIEINDQYQIGNDLDVLKIKQYTSQ